MAQRAAGVIAVDQKTFRVLMGQRAHGLPEPFTWCFPGGLCNPDETFTECAIREFREETAFKGRLNLYHFDYDNRDGLQYKTFMAFIGHFHPVADSETLSFQWVMPNNLPKDTHSGIYHMIPRLGLLAGMKDHV